MFGCLLGLFSVMVASFAQVLLKKSAERYEDTSFIQKFLNAGVLIAYIMLFLSLFLNTFVLKTLQLKYLPCLTATSFLWVLLFSRIFLKEHPTKNKLLGIAIIIVGVIVAQF